ncbi:LacI family DNA-binding transcriptional regulator [Dongia sp.]|uniref:LacI family DNA-binding transcriptional regulator n=1 Tax=Dongia sp. TaxID=1977262 RepID=UPI00375209D8
MIERPMRMTLSDVAREAGVSLATVDRVINRRPGVSSRSVYAVEQSLEKLGYRPDPIAAKLARRSVQRFCFVLPAGNNTFMRLLADQVEAARSWLENQRAFADVIWTDVFDPAALAKTLDGIDDSYEGVAVVALDHPMVRQAIDDLEARDIEVVTLVSDVPGSKRAHFVGIDNSAAGRTAATLLGRFAGGCRGPVAILAGSLSLRDHAERIYGFQQVLAADYPQLSALAVREGRDEGERARAVVEALLAEHPDLVGIYNAGAGNRGIAEALETAGRARDVIFVGHELTAHSRRFLMRGTMDAVINQDPGHEARSAARVLMALGLKQAIVPDQERIRIDIFVRDNLP